MARKHDFDLFVAGKTGSFKGTDKQFMLFAVWKYKVLLY
jgi:hypothetical protein